jgi:purine-binding chemotaxis protein CheW
MGSEERTFASCRVGHLLVGVAVDAVQEVTATVELTAVPLAPPMVSGLLNLRGQIVTAIDLRRSLLLAERPANEAPITLILRAESGSVGLLVDAVGDVLNVSDDDFEAPPSTLRGQLRDVITGAYKLDRGLLLVLDTERIVEESNGE